MARCSSRSKPRRFGISSRKSVSAEACSSSIRAWVLANCALRRRIVALVSLDAAGGRGSAAGVRRGAAFRPEAPLLGRFAALEAVALVFFFMAFPVQACLSRLAGIHQDRIVHS